MCEELFASHGIGKDQNLELRIKFSTLCSNSARTVSEGTMQHKIRSAGMRNQF